MPRSAGKLLGAAEQTQTSVLRTGFSYVAVTFCSFVLLLIARLAFVQDQPEKKALVVKVAGRTGSRGQVRHARSTQPIPAS